MAPSRTWWNDKKTSLKKSVAILGNVISKMFVYSWQNIKPKTFLMINLRIITEHHWAYLTCGVPQEVTYVGNNFTEGQALSSVSGKQKSNWMNTENRLTSDYTKEDKSTHTPHKVQLQKMNIFICNKKNWDACSWKMSAGLIQADRCPLLTVLFFFVFLSSLHFHHPHESYRSGIWLISVTFWSQTRFSNH